MLNPYKKKIGMITIIMIKTTHLKETSDILSGDKTRNVEETILNR